MNELTTYEYAKTIEALHEHLHRNMDEWWILDIVAKLQIQMRESVYGNR
jgi:hypothetical protein